jgi:serine phosphatase RsbU (regulator of sigma subunit)
VAIERDASPIEPSGEAVDSGTADGETITAPLERLRSLRTLARRLVDADDLPAVAHALMDSGIATAGAAGGSLMVVDGTRLSMVTHREMSDEVIAEWDEFTLRPGVDPISDALVDRTPRFYGNRRRMLAAYPHLGATLDSVDHQGWAVIPLIHGDKPVGALGVVFESPTTFRETDRLLLEMIGDLATQALTRVLASAEQRRSLESLGRALLNLDLETLPGVRTAALHRPATITSEAGGDWYDATMIDERRLLFVIGDVAHHGTAAVGEMGRARAIVLTHALQGASPRRIATRSSATLHRLSDTFTTVCIATYERAGRRLTWTSAGHPYPVLLRRGQPPEFLAGTHGPPLGVTDDVDYEMGQVGLEVGDVVIFYSDGLIERRTHDIDSDLSRLLDACADLAESVADLPNALVERLHSTFAHDDDIAVLAVEITE